MVVLRLATGQPVTSAPTWGEVHQVVVDLTRAGYSAHQIAARIGCTVRTVQRHRSVARQAA